MKSDFDTFTSGILRVCRPRPEVTDFQAVRNITGEGDLDVLYTLAYSEESRRTQDYEFAEQAGRKLDLKVKVRWRPDIDTDQRVLIGRKLYSIYEMDSSSDRRTLYLYLEEERDLE